MVWLDTLTCFYLCNNVNKSPFGKNSVTIQRLGGLLTIPIKSTIYGCLKVANIFISLFNSSKTSDVILGLKIFLIAT